MMDFSAGAGMPSGNGGGVIPNGQLAWVIINVRGVKPSKSGGQYIDMELTLDDNQPFARRKVWEMVGDPTHNGNSPEYKQMGMVAISRILESGRGAGPNNPGAYQISDYQQLSGLRVPVKLKIEKGKDGYDDKNKVSVWLTPNPQSDCAKDYQMLLAGVYNKATATPAQPAPNGFGGFGGQPQQQQANLPGFGQPQPQGQNAGSAASGFQQPALQTGFASSATSPSENFPTQDVHATFGNQGGGGGQPAWLAQANGTV